jgi:integrating conjugative element protein (TIGR03765 family)
MKKLPALAGLFMITSCYAYEIVNQELFIQEEQQKITHESLKLKAPMDARLPALSNASAGTVTKRKLDSVQFSDPIFIIGDDPLSRLWLKTHSKELEKIKALGFITNISDSNHLKELQKLTNAPLLPANVDDLLSLFHETHYPLMVVAGELWQ